MKTHTTIGYNMCMKDLKLRPYAAGAYYHHEALCNYNISKKQFGQVKSLIKLEN